MKEGSAPNGWAIAGICSIALVLFGGYEFARTSIDAMFLEVYGSRALPWAWNAGMVTTAGAVAIYNAFARRTSIPRLMIGCLVVSAVTLAALAASYGARIPGSTFLLYVWKEVHIVVLSEVLWSFAHSVFQIRTARKIYGFFCVFGSLGAIQGAWLAAPLRAHLGTDLLVWVPLLPFALVTTIAVGLARADRVPSERVMSQEKVSMTQSWDVLRGSHYLVWMLLLVGGSQIVINLIDYVYNAHIEQHFLAEATPVMSKVNTAFSASALVLQLFAWPIIRLLGVPRTLGSVPVILGSVLLGFLISPGFFVLAALKVASKGLDYSLFRTTKELLYVPLSYVEKTRGKSVVDMFGYRAGKAIGASWILWTLFAFGLETQASYLIATLIVLWIALVVLIGRRYRAIVPIEQER